MLGLEVVGEIKELTAEEAAAPPQSAALARLTPQKLRDSHHAVARMMAQGMRDFEISHITGYCVSKLSTLKRDPMFADLVKFYKDNESAATIDFMERAGLVARDALSKLHDMILEQDHPIERLTETFKVVADRAGFAPIQRSVNRNLNMNIGDRLDAARRRQEEAEDGR